MPHPHKVILSQKYCRRYTLLAFSRRAFALRRVKSAMRLSYRQIAPAVSAKTPALSTLRYRASTEPTLGSRSL